MNGAGKPVFQLLRGLGVAALATAAVTFLFHDWRVDLFHYFQLLAVTVAFSVAGLVNALVLKESRGARAFLMLSLYAVPMNFAALGGIFYAAESPSLPGPWIAAAVAFPTLLLVMGLALRVLCRPKAKLIGIALLVSSSLLLLPVRNLAVISCVVAAGLLLGMWFDQTRLFNDSAARTLEGWGARLAVFTPLLILLARTTLYYEWRSAVFLSTLFFTAAWLFAGLAHYLEALAQPALASAGAPEADEPPPGMFATPRHELATVLRLAALFPLGLACMLLPSVIALAELAFLPILVSVPFAFFGMTISRRSPVLPALVLLASSLGMLIQLALLHTRVPYSGGETVAVVSIALTFGLAAASYGYRLRSSLGFAAGGAVVVLSIVSSATLAYRNIDAPFWVPLSIAGAVLIVGASLLERNQQRFRNHWLQLQQHFRKRELGPTLAAEEPDQRIDHAVGIVGR